MIDNNVNLDPGSCPFSSLSGTFRLGNEELEAMLRRSWAHSPVTYLGDIDFWAVTRYEAIKTILRDNA